METDVQRFEELVTNLHGVSTERNVIDHNTYRVLAVATFSSGISWVVQVSTRDVHEVTGPLLASLARGWCEPRELVRLASNDEATMPNRSMIHKR